MSQRDLPLGVHARRHRLLRGSGGALSQPCWLTSTSGANARDQLRDHRVEGAQPAARRRCRRQGHVHGRARASGPPISLAKPVPGNSDSARLVQGDGQHPRVVPEDPLHAVAVVGVDVHVGDPLRRRRPAAAGWPARRRCRRRSRWPGRGVAWCMPPPKFTACTRRPVQDRLGRQRRCPARPGAGLVHAGERPGRRRCPARGRRPAVPGRRRPALHRGDVVRGRARWPAVRRRRPLGADDRDVGRGQAGPAPGPAGSSGPAAAGPSGWAAAEVVRQQCPRSRRPAGGTGAAAAASSPSQATRPGCAVRIRPGARTWITDGSRCPGTHRDPRTGRSAGDDHEPAQRRVPRRARSARRSGRGARRDSSTASPAVPRPARADRRSCWSSPVHGAAVAAGGLRDGQSTPVRTTPCSPRPPRSASPA